MNIWLLDDKKFPTGFANGFYKTKYPQRKKLYLAERHIDIMGACENSALLVKPLMPEDAGLLGIFAYPKPDTETLNISPDGIIDLTAALTENGFVYFSLPEGPYRLFVIFTTRTGGGRLDYMNLIDSESVRVQLEAVYQPHYERYKEDFGKTFSGFFSDEPELGNTPGYQFDDSLGKPDVKLPWSDQLEALLKAQWGADFAVKLPALWYGMGDETDSLRYGYMDCLTRLVQSCFTEQIGKWCNDRGVEYIGHIIEDDNAHSRLGCSIGHYFREHSGRNMGGVDVVHFQIVPGFTGRVHRWLTWETDGEFFHFGLAKLGSSAGHIDENKRGRSMCEIFGNYGWAESIPLMKWLTDHMLVRGINHFVPHAFSPKEFPDRDCPPHFYARGNNPQYRFFKSLMLYMNRAAELLSGGVYKTDAAVLYHAEAQWAGETMLFQKPVRRLMENQLDCDVVPADALCGKRAHLKNGRLHINTQSYSCLIIPGCEAVPYAAAEYIAELSSQGLPVFFADSRPYRSCEGGPLPKGFDESGRTVGLSELAGAVRAVSDPEIEFQPGSELQKEMPSLRFCCVEHEDGKIYMLFNEDTGAHAAGRVKILRDCPKTLTQYDPLSGKIMGIATEGGSFSIDLAPGESCFIIKDGDIAAPSRRTDVSVLDNGWEISKSDVHSYPEFGHALSLKPGESLPNLNAPGYFPEFTGYFRYKTSFAAKGGESAAVYLSKISDAADVKINGSPAGTILGNSGRVDISGLLRKGENILEIETANTLVWQVRDGASANLQVMSTGLSGPAAIEFYS